MAVLIKNETERTRKTSASRVYSPAPRTTAPHPLKVPGGRREPVPAAQPSATPARPMGQRGSRPVRFARELSWRNPMLAAVVVASFAVSLLCLYVAAYARVNANRLELARLRQDLKMAQRKEFILRGEISRCSLSVTPRAESLGLRKDATQSVTLLDPDAGALAPGAGGQ